MVAAGADMLDLGGESTRPGHEPVSAEESSLRGCCPVLERLAGRLAVPISIDTRKAVVAEAALAAGATIVNDVSGLDLDPRLRRGGGAAGRDADRRALARSAADDQADLIDWLAGGLAESVRTATAAGVPRTDLIVDPGLGFAKPPPVSLEILGRLRELRARLGLPLLIGASRKGFIGRVLDSQVEDRLEGSLATVAMSVAGRRRRRPGPRRRPERARSPACPTPSRYGWSEPMPTLDPDLPRAWARTWATGRSPSRGRSASWTPSARSGSCGAPRCTRRRPSAWPISRPS